MTKTELEEWAIEVFWPAYKTLCATPFVTKWTGGGRGEAVKKILQLNPAEELRGRIMDAIQSQTLHRKKLYDKLGSMQAYEGHTKFKKLYANRDGKTWLYNHGWEDEIPSLAEEIETSVKPVERCKHCGEIAHGPGFDVCTFHVLHDKDGKLTSGIAPELRRYYKEHPEIHNFNREQAVEFMKDKLRQML